MNLAKLFEMQRKLDERIMEEHPEIRDQDNLGWKTLALQVEIAECANEWRGFKKWSRDQNPRTKVAFNIGYKTVYKNPLLEEYVDALHFILSIGLEHGFDSDIKYTLLEPIEERSITLQFSALMQCDWDFYEVGDSAYYIEGLELFLGLGEMLGFTWEQIEEAYMKKNKENHMRQANGY